MKSTDIKIMDFGSDQGRARFPVPDMISEPKLLLKLLHSGENGV